MCPVKHWSTMTASGLVMHSVFRGEHERGGTLCDCAGKRYRRETSTMPQWAGSCWYYVRYLQPWNTERPVDPEVEQYWLPVDLYVGGLPFPPCPFRV
jgi:hypothetical protein